MHLRCGGIFNDSLIASFLLLKIVQYLAKLWTRVYIVSILSRFLTHGQLEYSNCTQSMCLTTKLLSNSDMYKTSP